MNQSGLSVCVSSIRDWRNIFWNPAPLILAFIQRNRGLKHINMKQINMKHCILKNRWCNPRHYCERASLHPVGLKSDTFQTSVSVLPNKTAPIQSLCASHSNYTVTHQEIQGHPDILHNSISMLSNQNSLTSLWYSSPWQIRNTHKWQALCHLCKITVTSHYHRKLPYIIIAELCQSCGKPDKHLAFLFS